MALFASNSIAQVLRFRDQLHCVATADPPETFWDGDYLELLVDRLLKIVKVNRVALYRTLEPFIGILPTDEAIRAICWRIAGNLPQLRQGYSLGPERVFPAWCPLQVVATTRQQRGDRRGHLLTLRVLSGIACPTLIEEFWTHKKSRFFALRMGFTRINHKYPLRDADELYGLRFDAHCVPQPDGSWELDKYIRHGSSVPESMLEHNRNLIRLRARIDPGYVCPRKYPSTFHCTQCLCGVDQCGAATHPTTYILQACPSCKRDNMPFAPNEFFPECLNCRNKAAWAQQKKIS